MGKNQKQDCKRLSLLERFRNLLGAGLYLLVTGLIIEISALFLRQWISFPFPMTPEIKIVLAFICVLACLLGAIWFYINLNLIKIHLLSGENKLITKGPFSYVRHPLYATLLITLPPLMIIWYADILFLLTWILIYIIAHYIVLIEEKGLIEIFDEDYKTYCTYVPALLPFKGAGGVRYREEYYHTVSGDDARIG